MEYYDSFDCEITCEEFEDDLMNWETEQCWLDEQSWEAVTEE